MNGPKSALTDASGTGGAGGTKQDGGKAGSGAAGTSARAGAAGASGAGGNGAAGGISGGSGGGGAGNGGSGAAGTAGKTGDAGSAGQTGSQAGQGGDSGGQAGASNGLPADCPRVKLGGAGTLVNVRSAPNTGGAPVASLPNGTILTATSKVVGEAVDGNTTWFGVDGQAKGFVSGAVAACTTEEPPKAPDGYLLPFACGFSTTVTQGNKTQFSHTGTSAYAFDFGVPMGTPVAAMAAGTVKFAHAGTKPGDPCYQGGGQSCINAANYVNIAHGDGTVTQYAHLSEVHVSVGATVARGQIIGKSGNTGWSTGAHLHAERQGACNHAFCQTIAMTFADAGVPGTGAKVTSGNCP